eukprot:4340392-Amphidinium_carterae.1
MDYLGFGVLYCAVGVCLARSGVLFLEDLQAVQSGFPGVFYHCKALARLFQVEDFPQGFSGFQGGFYQGFCKSKAFAWLLQTPNSKQSASPC